MFEKCKKSTTIQQNYAASDQEVDGNLYSDLVPMLYSSDLVYAFAILRKKVRDKDEDKGKINIYEGEDLIKAGVSSMPTKSSISVQDVTEFIGRNLGALKGESSINSDLFKKSISVLGKLQDAHLVRFNGIDAGKTFVYGILVNHDKKRITVVFRGSSVSGDWLANMQFFKGTLPTRGTLKDVGFDENKEIYVHHGFKNYLLDKDGPSKTQKYSEIKNTILHLYENGHKGHTCKGYELYVTGHSLGGALSTLMSFSLAASRQIATHLGKKPVVNISFASPYVGGKNWAEAFKVLENAGKIQHIRVSNQNDIVPVVLTIPNFKHVGVNLHLNPDAKDGYQLSYQGKRSFLSQVRFFMWKHLGHHGLKEYDERMNAIQLHIKGTAIKSIYTNPYITQAFQNLKKSMF